MKLKFQKIFKDAKMPSYAKAGDSGMDVFAYCDTIDGETVRPCNPKTIGTGLRAEIPAGYELQVRPKSGLSANGIEVAWGTVDEGYRGEIKVTVYNHTEYPIRICHGSKIAQLVLAPVVRAEIEEVAEIGTDTDRGTGGFGSTGL